MLTTLVLKIVAITAFNNFSVVVICYINLKYFLLAILECIPYIIYDREKGLIWMIVIVFQIWKIAVWVSARLQYLPCISNGDDQYCTKPLI